MIGLEERDTKSGIHVVRVHYTADPAKRDPEWVKRAAVGMAGGTQGKAWRREMEIDWTVATGLGVYSDLFDREVHVAKEELLAFPNLPIYRGWDFGLTPACVWSQLDPVGWLNVLAVEVTWNGRGPMKQMDISQFAPVVIVRSNEWYPGVRFIDDADPSGWQKAQTDSKTCVQIMRELGIPPRAPRPEAVTFQARKRAMSDRLCQLRGIRISPTCQILIEGMEGAYRFEEIGETGRYKEHVEQNAWAHPMSALEYTVLGVFGSGQGREQRKLPRKGKPNKVTGY